MREGKAVQGNKAQRRFFIGTDGLTAVGSKEQQSRTLF